MSAFPNESDLFPSGAVSPATAKSKFQQFFQAVIGLLGTTGDAADARAALGLASVAASGSAADLSTGTLPAARLPAATTAAVGGVQLSTNSQAQTGTDTSTALTPAAFSAASLGRGQTWQDVTASRALSTNYTNSTGKPIFVSVCSGISAGTASLTVSGQVVAQQGNTAAGSVTLSAIVPPGATYSFASPAAISSWFELR